MSALGQQRTFGRVAKENFLYLFGLWRSTYGYYARWPAKNFAIGIFKFTRNSDAPNRDWDGAWEKRL